MITERLASEIRASASRYLADIQALDDAALLAAGPGSARAPIDFSWEAAYLNTRIAQRLRGEDPGPFPDGGWMCAPPDRRTKEDLCRYFEDASESLAQECEKLTDDQLTTKVVASGSEPIFLEIIMLAIYHMNYHDGQLNYIQAMAGDSLVHWD